MNQQSSPDNNLSFLQGGGEMGELTRQYDWNKTSLGNPEHWPVSLRTLVNMMLTSRFPMLIFWGKDLITFYNDAFRPSLGNDGKHPGSLGQRGEESWAESWPTIGPMIYNIMAGGEAVWFEDQKLPIYREGKMDYAYWTYSFSPLADDEGNVSGILVTCSETTKAVESVMQLQEANVNLEESLAENRALQEQQQESHERIEKSQQQLLSLFEQSPVALATIIREDLTFTSANPFYGELVGRKPHDIIGKPLLEALPEIAGQGFDELLRGVLDTGIAYVAPQVPVDIKRNGVLETIYVNLAYQPMKEEDGSIPSILVVATDVTPQVRSIKEIEQSQQRFQNLVKEAPVGIVLLTGEEMIVDMVNEAYAKMVGHTTTELLHHRIFDVIPDAEVYFRPVINNVRVTGEDFHLINVPYKVKDNKGEWVEGYITLNYQPYREADGTITGVMVVVYEVSDQVEALQKVQDSETRFRTLIEEAPMAVNLFTEYNNHKIEIVNDKMLQVWGKDKSIIGKPLLEALPELKDQPFTEILNEVYKTSQPYTATEAPASLEVNGVLSTYYFNFTYQPIFDAEGKVHGIINMALDVTEQVQARQAVERSEARFRSLIEEAPIATCLFTGRDMVIEVANEIMLQYIGKDRSAIGKPLIEAMPELNGQPFMDILDKAYTTGEPYNAIGAPATIEIDGKLETHYFDFTYKPVRNEKGEVYGILETSVNVTSQVVARQALERSEAQLQAILANAPVAISLFTGPEFTLQYCNGQFLKLLGKDASIIGHPIQDAIVEPKFGEQPFIELLEGVYKTGKKYSNPAITLKVDKDGVPEDCIYHISYTPLLDAEGKIYAVLSIALDVTKQETARREAEESALFTRSVIDNSPIAKIVFRGEDMVVDIVNRNMLEMIARDESIVGKPFFEVMPELKATQLRDRLLNVYRTGETYIQPEERIELMKNGTPQTGYYTYIYKALRNTAGDIYGIIVTATEITEQVKARQLIEEAEEELASAIDMAELGTWTIDLIADKIHYPERMEDWFGLKSGSSLQALFDIIPPSDSIKMQEAIASASAANTDGIMDIEHAVINPRTGRQRIIHARGHVLRDENDNRVSIHGISQDVTLQREVQFALEAEVQLRTEELAASNEELLATNDQLAIVNQSLTASNEELSQYAYVASHDLQEPLRKIRVFADLLAKKEQSEQSKVLVEKISTSAERMSLLIQDLLQFSRLLRSDTLVQPIDLNNTIKAVWNDFELMVSEKGATLHAGSLPTIEAVNLQMNQLFYNLLGNSLKFTTPDRKPEIHISCVTLTHEQTAKYIRNPWQDRTYYHITFRDNGIGFEAEYADKIFEVFKRLHGRDIYPGSGIGLALCRRIVANHQGHLFAASTPGKGSEFHVILPDSQP